MAAGEKSFVQIYTSDHKKAVGAGFALSAKNIATCSHVIDAVFGDKEDKLGKKVCCGLPFSGNRNARFICVVRVYKSPKDRQNADTLEDITILEISEENPSIVLDWLPNADIPDSGTSLALFGENRLAAGVGKHIHATCIREVPCGWVQLNLGANEIQALGGFSGGPVFNSDYTKCFGIFVAQLDATAVTYMIPIRKFQLAYREITSKKSAQTSSSITGVPWLFAAVKAQIKALKGTLFLQALLEVTECSNDEDLMDILVPNNDTSITNPIDYLIEAVIYLKNNWGAQEDGTTQTHALNLASYLALATLNPNYIGVADCYHEVPVDGLTAADIYSSGLAQVPASLRQSKVESNSFNVEDGLISQIAINQLELSIYIKLGLKRVFGILPGAPLNRDERASLRKKLTLLADSKKTLKPRCAAIFIHRSKLNSHALADSVTRQELITRLSDSNGKALVRIIVWGKADNHNAPSVFVVEESDLITVIDHLLETLGVTE